MGREIRRVPKGWFHPPNRPLYDEVFEDVASDWLAQAIAWSKGEHPDQQIGGLLGPAWREKYPFFWQWHGDPPDANYYRPRWKTEPTCFQIYETVSEGTPTSPVFETLDELVEWLVNDGGEDGPVSRAAAEAFAKSKWAPSMVVGPGGITAGIAASAQLAKKVES